MAGGVEHINGTDKVVPMLFRKYIIGTSGVIKKTVFSTKINQT